MGSVGLTGRVDPRGEAARGVKKRGIDMGMYWFTGDQHFNHGNIIRYCGRPFRDIPHMNQVIMEKFNERVDKGDTVYHLGDLKHGSGFESTWNIVSNLNGNHVFIRGNHDSHNGMNSPLRYCVIKSYGAEVLLCHRPEDAVEIAKKLGVYICFTAHVHEKWKFQVRDDVTLVNVGVDQWEFYPVGAKQIFKALKNWRKI